MKKNKGFTLLELLVVIAIIGILSSVVLASLNNARVRARDTNRITDVKQIQLALELYFDSNSSAYPTALTDLVPLYISVEPRDPSTGDSYFYAYSSTGSDYHLGALMEDAGNSLLTEDADRDSSVESFVSLDTRILTGFNGGSTDCVSGSGADQCYDARP